MTDMNDPVVAAIVSCRVSLLFNQPFFGNLATRMKLIDATKWCKTAATDGRNFYYNREFIKALEPQQLLFLMAHEVLHCVYDHLGRKGSRDPKIFNMANDYIVNYTLVKEEVGKMPKEGLYDTRYSDEMTSEEVYRLLEQNSTKIQMTLDEHLDMDGSDGEDGEGNGGTVSVTVMGDGNGPPKLTEADKQAIRNELRAAVINAAQAVGAGKVPAGVKRLIDMFTNPIMDWRTLLELHIQSSIKDDYTFQKPSKRSWSAGISRGGRQIILPGQNYKNTIDIAVAIDTSGSMTDDMLRDFLSEVKGIMDTFEDFKLTLWTFDTKVYNPKVFTMENLDEILDYQPAGGGGTMFECCFDFMKDPSSQGFGDEFPEEIDPKKFCMFTDGYPNSTWGDENLVDTLFVIHGSTSIEAPFGLTAYYNKTRHDHH
jgi:predicted metal-dependent peptidase